ncbi:hypothetical protein Tco_1289524 [Tanacetum coccineum]
MKKAKPVISHHNAWIKSVSMKKRLARKKSLNTKLMQKESTEDAHDEGKVKDSEETRVSTKDPVSTDMIKVSSDKLKVSTDKPNEGTAEPNEDTAEPNECTAEPKDGNSYESATLE